VVTVLVDQFRDVSSGEQAPEQFKRMREQLERIPPNLDTNEVIPYNEPISMLELHTALKQSKNSSPGADKISYALLKKIHPTALSFLLSIYNSVWKSNTYPKQWLTAIALPFLKPGKPNSEASSYRPIALTNCMGKLMERIIHTRLMNHLEANDHISPIQFGFRKNHCTTDPLMRLSTHVQENIHSRRHTIAVFFDLRKAYDTIWRFGLVRDLESYGIKGNMAHYIRNFLSDRSFKVKYNRTISTERHQIEGVPQGSVLSCALFILAMNSVANVIPPEVSGSLFLDDIMIYASSARLPLLERRFQQAVLRIERWAT